MHYLHEWFRYFDVKIRINILNVKNKLNRNTLYDCGADNDLSEPMLNTINE